MSNSRPPVSLTTLDSKVSWMVSSTSQPSFSSPHMSNQWPSRRKTLIMAVGFAQAQQQEGVSLPAPTWLGHEPLSSDVDRINEAKNQHCVKDALPRQSVIALISRAALYRDKKMR
jgi:hypothetical protein